jgi:transcriptional regulator with XRE-family HTH domain
MLTNEIINCYKSSNYKQGEKTMMSAQKTVRRIRLNLLLEKHEFAEKLGITRSAVYNYENGNRLPNMEVIRKIKKLAEENHIPFSVDDFFEDDSAIAE